MTSIFINILSNFAVFNMALLNAFKGILPENVTFCTLITRQVVLGFAVVSIKYYGLVVELAIVDIRRGVVFRSIIEIMGRFNVVLSCVDKVALHADVLLIVEIVIVNNACVIDIALAAS